MADTRWRQVKEVFHAALDRDPEERRAFLAAACGGDESLREEVESLLAEDDDSLPWIDSPVFEAAAESLTDRAEPEPEIRELGPYKIVRKLGQGGMGSVYLAERADEQYQRRVAIKIVRQDLSGEDAVRRFRQERQILASLDHPHIARLLDGGMTEEGLPYFIMEYIEGVPIDRYCDRESLSLSARIELFRKVCWAVHYAHRHLVVHCDLKPSNILVTEDGEPKLLDFGIARLLSTEFVPQAVTVTMDDSRRLTPEYASPEQVRGERPTTASDVYSLGVLLYRLLTGKHPFHFRNRSMWEIERVIREEDPTKPSEVAELQSLEGSPERLRRLLGGDLDNIVLMAVHKDPAKRFGSVGQLSEDLRRHQEGMPVVARKDTFGYRVSKFVHRHRAGVLAALLTALSLVAGTVVSTWLAYEATAARAKAERVSDFLERLFQGADPSWERWKWDLRVGDLLDEGARLIRTELADQPEERAQILQVMGMAYLHLGSFEKATRFLEEAETIRRRVVGREDPQYAKSLYSLCTLWREQGDYDRARSFCLETLAFWRRYPEGEVAEDLVKSLRELALVYRHLGLYDEAEALYGEGLALGRRHLGEGHLQVAMTQQNLGGLLRIRGRFEEAEPLLRRAKDLFSDLLGPDHPSVASSLNTLAALFSDQGDFATAERTYLEALDIWRTVTPDHPEVALILNNLGALYYVRKDYEAAEPRLLEALELYRKNGLGDRREVVVILNHLAALRRALGDLRGAESRYREALELGRKRFGAEYPSLTISLIGLGRVLTELGNAQEARGLLLEALKIRESTYTSGHWRTANAKSHLGACLTALGRFEEAENYLLEAHRTLVEQRGEEHRYTQEALRDLVRLYETWPKPAEAARLAKLLPD